MKTPNVLEAFDCIAKLLDRSGCVQTRGAGSAT
jgi:hypothetical protein